MAVPDPQQAVGAVFDKIADEYDAVGVDFFKPIAARLVDELAPRPSERVLDVGCGRGAALIPLANAVGSGGQAIGIDASPRMVELTAKDIESSGVGAEVLVGDAMQPDFPHESFDIVASSLVLFFLPDPLAALRAWRELLVGNGRVGVSTFGPYSDPWQRVDDVLRPYAPAQMLDARTTGTEGPFSSAEATARLVGDAGFSDIRTVVFDLPVRFVEAQQWYRWSMSVGQRRLWDNVPESDWEDVKTRAFAAIATLRDEQGYIGFDQEVRLTLARR